MLREIEPGSPAFALFVSALRASDLPTEDLTAAPFRYFSADDLAWGGFGAGEDALLRSVVVSPQARGRGHGAALTELLAAHARADGVERLWLLTTSAEPFFERLGWRAMQRSSAPPVIACSRQFSELCPASSALMVRAL